MATIQHRAAVERPVARAGFGPLALAGGASIGAGAIHAVAVGSHADHPQAARAFVVLAALQVAWGAVAMAGRHLLVAASGVGLGAMALGGWVLAKTSGIGFVDGLDAVESIQRADALAAVLAAVATVVSLRAVLTADAARLPGRSLLGVATAVVLVASLVGMDGAGTHAHEGGHEDAAGHADGGHHGAEAAAGDDHAGDDHAGDDHAGDDHAGDDHAEAEAAAKPYDPAAPIDLGGVEGVTPAQQAAAENLVAITLARLPQFADRQHALDRGYFSIGDALTGHEHLINWELVDDGKVLDPDAPEALVYETGPGGSRTLVSAMFMLPTGTTLDEVPELGGELTQWHIHDDLCFSDDPVSPHVAGVTSVGGDCRPPTRKLDPVPMIHVWITKHRCGPFAALEGVGAGQVAEGETKACDHAHGA